jgi:hypothetical protein
MFNGEKRVGLFYDGAQATSWYVQRGYDVLRVTKGDYRKVHRPATGAQPNMLAVREASDFLGLMLPVKVRVSGRQGGLAGAWTAHYRAGGWYHDIVVKNWLSVEDMGRTLWHELVHALQFERDSFRPGLPPREVVTRHNKAYRDGTAYRNKPWEVEANSYMDYNSEIALAR